MSVIGQYLANPYMDIEPVTDSVGCVGVGAGR